MNRWQELRHVTIPLMLPTIVITLGLPADPVVEGLRRGLSATGGGPGTATEVINFSIYRVFFQQDRVGLGSAMSLLDPFRHRAARDRCPGLGPPTPRPEGRSMSARAQRSASAATWSPGATRF